MNKKSMSASDRIRFTLAATGFFLCACQSSERIPFPDLRWDSATETEKSLDVDELDQIDSLMREAHSNGILIVDGKVIREWTYDGPVDKKIEVQSITKSMVSLLLGIAIQESKIGSINDKVINYYPAFQVGPYTDEITFRHLVTTSSGIEAKKYGSNYSNPGNMPPGIDARYHNDHFDQLATALTYIFQQPLVEVLRDRVLSITGGTVEWGADGEVTLKDGRGVPVNAGYAFSKWTAADLARIGWLYLNNGNWNGKQIINAQYVADSRTRLDIPVMVSRGNQPVVVDTGNTYGYGWRGTFVSDSRVLWHMSGNGGQFCAVIPELNMVFVKINGYSEKYKPYRGIGLFKNHLLSLRKDKPGFASPL
jgi:CubicO group peptidase (beta-lactamase class C family)